MRQSRHGSPPRIAAHRSRQVQPDGAGHLHGLGYLGAGSRPRCGCDGPSAIPDRTTGEEIDLYEVVFTGRKQTGFIRTHFIYSDRLLRARSA